MPLVLFFSVHFHHNTHLSGFSEFCPRHVSTFFDNDHVLTLIRSSLCSLFSSSSSSLVSQTARSCVNCVHDTCQISFDNHHVLTLIRSSLFRHFSSSSSSLVSQNATRCEVSMTRVYFPLITSMSLL